MATPSNVARAPKRRSTSEPFPVMADGFGGMEMNQRTPAPSSVRTPVPLFLTLKWMTDFSGQDQVGFWMRAAVVALLLLRCLQYSLSASGGNLGASQNHRLSGSAIPSEVKTPPRKGATHPTSSHASSAGRNAKDGIAVKVRRLQGRSSPFRRTLVFANPAEAAKHTNSKAWS